MEKQVAKVDDIVRVEGVDVCVVSHPDVDRVTVKIGEGIELTFPSPEARVFALVLLRAAVESSRAPKLCDLPTSGRVM